MHPDIDKLLDRIDHDPQMRAIVQRLRDLPDATQPPYDWTEFQRRAAARRSEATGHGGRYAAIAASFAFLVAGAALWSRFGGSDPSSLPAFEAVEATGFDPDKTPEAALTAHWLETWEEPVIVRVGSRMTTAELEDRLAFVDDLLSAERIESPQPERVAQLQRDRERLVHSLVQLRYAETLTAGLP